MKSIKKGISLAILVIGGLAVAPAAQAKVSMSSIKKSAQNLLDKTQAKAGSTYENIKSSLKKSSSKVNALWDDLSPETQAALLAALGTAGLLAAGVGYAMLSGDGGVAEGPDFDAIWNKMTPEDQAGTLDLLSKIQQ